MSSANRRLVIFLPPMLTFPSCSSRASDMIRLRKMLKRVGLRRHLCPTPTLPYSVKGFFEVSEDMVQILLVLEVLFTQDSEVEDLFCGASSGSEPSLFFSNYFFSVGFKPIQDNFQHDFA